jgi:transcriptional regulator with XRE-family HTH domain
MRIREAIEQQGMTTKEVADKLNISISALNQNISGNPSVKVLTKIAEAINVPVWQLFASPEEVNSNTSVCPYCGMPIKLDKGE